MRTVSETNFVKSLPIEWQAAFDVTRRFHNAAIHGIDLVYPLKPKNTDGLVRTTDEEIYIEANAET